MKKVRNVLIRVFAVVLLLSISCTLAGCGLFDKAGIDPKKEEKAHNKFIEELGGVSDTYVGSVSKSVYASKEDTAEAYVSEQIAGNSNYTVVSVGAGEALSQDQIAGLKLSAEDAQGIQSVEAVDITISIPQEAAVRDSGITLLSASDSSRTVKVYIIKYESGFKYYSPCPVTGETVTKAYYDSVFNSEKYKNCTYTTTTTVQEEIKLISFIKIKVDVVTSQTIRYADNAIYIEQKTDFSMFGEDTATYAYVVQEENGFMNCYVSTDGVNWDLGDLTTVGFHSLDQLTPFYDQYLDYTYFTKTDYGFELADINAEQYVQEALDEIDLFEAEDIAIDMFAKYYVCDGTLTGMRMEMYMDFAVSTGSEDEKMDVGASAVTEVKITDCGTTVVELPAELTNK